MSWGGRGWAAVGSFPKGCSHVRRYVGRMRAELEAAVLVQHGEVGVYHAALIQSACRHEGRALLLTRWLRLETDNGASLADRLGMLSGLGNATDSRDKCLKSLGLDQVKLSDIWDIIDNPPRVGHTDAPGRNGSDPTPETADVAQPHDTADSNAHTANGQGPEWQEHADGLHEVSTSGAEPVPSVEDEPC